MSPARRSNPLSPAARTALRRLALDAGQAIRDERMRRRWSMSDLADRAGVAIGVVHRVEAGDTASLESYARLGVALGMRSTLEFADVRQRRRGASIDASADFVHSAMGELEARMLAQPGVRVSLDEPYQHYQFAGRADVLAWDQENLLHIENRTRFPNLQEAAGAYNAKRQYLASSIAQRRNLGPRGWRSVTHVMACLWSSEVLHAIRLRRATFEALCPDPIESFETWLAGDRPGVGVTSALAIVDPAALGTRRRTIAGIEEVDRAVPRFRGYADAAEALRIAQRGRVTKTPQPR